MLIAAMGGECQYCNYLHSDMGKMTLHHIDAGSKLFEPNKRISKTTLVIKEARKCVLLCDPCHAMVHNKDINLTGYPSIDERWIRKVSNTRLMIIPPTLEERGYLDDLRSFFNITYLPNGGWPNWADTDLFYKEKTNETK